MKKGENILEFKNDILAVSAAKFINCLFEAGWTEVDVNRIARWSDDVLNLSELVKIVRGEAEMKITINKHVVNLNQKPLGFRGSSYGLSEQNKCFGQLDLHRQRIGLFMKEQ